MLQIPLFISKLSLAMLLPIAPVPFVHNLVILPEHAISLEQVIGKVPLVNFYVVRLPLHFTNVHHSLALHLPVFELSFVHGTVFKLEYSLTVRVVVPELSLVVSFVYLLWAEIG